MENRAVRGLSCKPNAAGSKPPSLPLPGLSPHCRGSAWPRPIPHLSSPPRRWPHADLAGVAAILATIARRWPDLSCDLRRCGFALTGRLVSDTFRLSNIGARRVAYDSPPLNRVARKRRPCSASSDPQAGPLPFHRGGIVRRQPCPQHAPAPVRDLIRPAARSDLPEHRTERPVRLWHSGSPGWS